MSYVIPDIQKGSGAKLTNKGWEFERVFNVSELSAVGHARAIEAVQATNVPYGAPHPAWPSAYAVDFTPVQIDSNDAMNVIIRYKEYSEDYLVEVGSRVVSKDTTQFFIDPDDRDSLKNEMVLVYTYPDDYNKAEGFAGEQVKDGLLLQRKEYPPNIIITRTEYGTIWCDVESGWPIGVKLTGEIITDRVQLYNGKTNKSGWDLRPNDPEHVWQCQISASSAEDGLAYRVRYEFSYDPDKWQYTGTFKDPNTGEPVPDPEEGDNASFYNYSRKKFDMYLAEDFNLLSLY